MHAKLINTHFRSIRTNASEPCLPTPTQTIPHPSPDYSVFDVYQYADNRVCAPLEGRRAGVARNLHPSVMPATAATRGSTQEPESEPEPERATKAKKKEGKKDFIDQISGRWMIYLVSSMHYDTDFVSITHLPSMANPSLESPTPKSSLSGYHLLSATPSCKMPPSQMIHSA